MEARLKRLLFASLLLATPALAQQPSPRDSGATPCPTGMPQCVWVAMPPQALNWLAGTMPSLLPGGPPPTAKDSILDYAAKAVGADGSAVIAQVLLYLRAAQPGSPSVPLTRDKPEDPPQDQ
jgi:hypothetical protein